MLDDAIRKLRDLQRRAEQLNGEHSVPFTELFHDEFMLRNTDFPSINTMFETSGFRVETTEDFFAIPDDTWEAFVREHSRFRSWGAMKSAAVQEWAMRRMEFE